MQLLKGLKTGHLIRVKQCYNVILTVKKLMNNRFHHQAQALMSWCLANVCRPFSSPPLQNSNYKSQLQRNERWRQQCIEGFQQPPSRHNCPTSPGNPPSARPFLPTSLPLCVCLPAPENIPLSGLAENDVWGGGIIPLRQCVF